VGSVNSCQLSALRQDVEVATLARDMESLVVLRRAYALSLDGHSASLLFPKVEQFSGIADQLRRASKSVCALLVEGAGRQGTSDVEFRRYVRMALGSCEEAKLWCRYAEDLGYVAPEVAETWRSEHAEIGRMLNGLVKRLSDS
jgi:four helix bundle protein